MNRILWSVAALMLCAASPGFAQALERLAVGVGAFTVRNGGTSTAIQGGYYFMLEPDQFYEMGVDVQYRTLRSAVFGVPDVPLTSISAQGLILLRPVQPPVVPYVGVGVMLGYSFFEESAVESKRPEVDVTDAVAGSLGVLLAAGVRIELESGISFFGEYRYGWDSFPMELAGSRSSVEQGGSWLLVGLGVSL